jgi:adenosylmethionine-8-amino-7-oxononanoate aminotransferase
MDMPSRSNASRVFHRALGHDYPQAVSGRGSWIYDAEGRAYLDASGGAAVSCLGHGDRRVAQAIRQQLDSLAYTHSSFFTTGVAEALADRLSSAAPGGPWRVFFVSGGSEATEAALKLARQIQVERGRASRDHFVSRHFSYHGNTLGALSVGGHLGRRKLYGPILPPNVRHIPPVYAYRHQRSDETAEAYGLRMAKALEDTIVDTGPERVIAFIAETVVGATLGAVPATPGYFREIRSICDRHGVLIILDEVMCGMARCGTRFAFEQEGVVPDMITLAKGLGAGYQPIGALMVSEKIVGELERGSGAFQHGHTYVGHAVACAAALAVQEIIEQEGLVERVARVGDVLAERLRDRFGNHPHVGDIRGRGLMRALELVEDRADKRPFPAAAKLWSRVKAAAMAEGLICYPSGGTADGTNGDHVLIAPPYTISVGDLDELVRRLDRALSRSLAEIAA